MVKKRRKKPGANRVFYWVVVILIIGALITGYRLWSCLYNTTPRFNFILLNIDGSPLKLLDGEKISLHPNDIIRIQDISTNICFNRGIRLVARGLDPNAFRYEEMPLSDLLPGGNILEKYDFKIEIRHYNQAIGSVDITVEPLVEDWMDKVDRSIGNERKAAVLEQAHNFAPDDKRIMDRLVKEYISLKQWNKAAAMLEEVYKEDPDPSRLKELLNVYEAMSHMEGGPAALKRMVELKPEDADSRFRLAEALEKEGDVQGALREYETLLGLLPKEDLTPVYKQMGFLYTETKQYDKAISAYLKAVEADSEDVNIYYNLSFLYEKEGKQDEADLYLGKALELKSNDIDGRIRLAESLIKKGNLKEAEKHLKEVIKSRPESKRAWPLMVIIAEKRGDKEGLKRAYQKILGYDPLNMTLIYNLGVIEYETGNLTKALPYLKKYVEARPKDSEARALLFDIYRRQKKDDLAFAEATALLQLKPEEKVYYQYIFEYLNSRGNYEEMIKIMREGLKTHPKDADLEKYLILAYLKTEKDDLAIGQIKELLEADPQNITMLLQLARLLEKRDRPREALAVYKEILDISPGHEEAEDAYLRLRLNTLPHE